MADAGTLTLDRVLEPPTAPASLTGRPPVAPSGSSRRVLGAAALIVIAGAAIRFAALSTSIWFDESVTVRDVSGSFGQMLHRVVNHEASPPFYFLCLWIWRHLVGDTGADLRALSALAGTITIALAFYVARRRIGPRAGLILATCVAVSPILVGYSTQMRMYGVLVLITGIGFEAFLRASESPNRRNLGVWATASVLALWTQYYAALAVAPQAIWLIGLAWKHRSRARATLAAVGGAVLAGLPLIYLIGYQGQRAWPYGARLISSVWHQVPLDIRDTGTTFGSLAQDVTVGPGGPARALLNGLIVLIGVAIAVLLLRRPERVEGQLLRASCLILPPVVVAVILVQSHILFEGRYLLPLWLPVGLAASSGLASAGWPGALLACLLLCIWLGIGVVSLAVPQFRAHDDTLGAARSLSMAHGDRLIAISEPWDVVALEEYRPQTSAETDPVVRVRELDVVAMPVGGEPSPVLRARPLATGAGAIPRGLRLVQVVKGSTFLVERFIASRPVPIRVDGRGNAFTSSNWRFLTEPAGGGMGAL
jgi:Dolichyl-phosphate-mannose-protein mannosyltransferase